MSSADQGRTDRSSLATRSAARSSSRLSARPSSTASARRSASSDRTPSRRRARRRSSTSVSLLSRTSTRSPSVSTRTRPSPKCRNCRTSSTGLTPSSKRPITTWRRRSPSTRRSTRSSRPRSRARRRRVRQAVPRLPATTRACRPSSSSAVLSSCFSPCVLSSEADTQRALPQGGEPGRVAQARERDARPTVPQRVRPSPLSLSSSAPRPAADRCTVPHAASPRSPSSSTTWRAAPKTTTTRLQAGRLTSAAARRPAGARRATRGSSMAALTAASDSGRTKVALTTGQTSLSAGCERVLRSPSLSLTTRHDTNVLFLRYPLHSTSLSHGHSDSPLSPWTGLIHSPTLLPSVRPQVFPRTTREPKLRYPVVPPSHALPSSRCSL